MFQFVARLKRYLDRWTERSKIFLCAKKLINTFFLELGLCSSRSVCLKQTQLAEQYLEAHGSTITQQKTYRSAQFSNRSSQRTHQQSFRQDDKPQDKKSSNKFCFYCKKEGHFGRDCRAKEKRRTVAAAREVSSDEQQGGRRPFYKNRDDSPNDWRKRGTSPGDWRRRSQIKER